MPNEPTTKSTKSDRTRAAILNAARHLFAEHGYDGTTIREIATAAVIDPAMVMRYFGSKEELFARAAAFDLALPALSKVTRTSIGERLVRHFLEVWEGPNSNGSMAILLRSAATNELSAQKMREVFAAQVMPAVASVGTRATAGRRAAMVSSQLLGLAFCRYLLRLQPLVEMSIEEIVAHLGPTIQRYAVGES